MTQKQREALLNLLILSTFVDSHLSIVEDDSLDTAIESLGWDSTKLKEIFMLNSVSRARRVSDTDESTDVYIKAAASEFSDAASQASALEYLERVLASDKVSAAESAFIAKVKAAFPKA